MHEELRWVRGCRHIARVIARESIYEHLASGHVASQVKADRSVVTEADRRIEARIRAYLAAEFPGYGVIGEEFGASNAGSEYVWTIDPIDGTEAFVSGVPQFGTLLALIHQAPKGRRRPVLGAIYLPVQDELIVGNRSATVVNGVPVRFPEPPNISQQCLIMGDIAVMVRKLTADRLQKVMSLAAEFRAAPTWGDCLGYLNMLLGKAHARLEAGLGIDDVAPLEPIILGAGGYISDWEGQSLETLLSGLPSLAQPADFGIIAAVSPGLHREVMARL